MSALVWVLSVLCLILLAWGLLGKGLIYRFPFLFTCSFATFALPQVIALDRNPSRLPPGALDSFVIVAILCLLAAWVGEHFAVRRSVESVRAFEDYDVQRLSYAALGMTLIGVGAVQVGGQFLSEEYMANLGTQWSGPVIIVMFFVTVQKYGFVLSLLVFWHTRSMLTLWLVLFGIYGSAMVVLVSVRCAAAIDLFFILLLCPFFVKRWVIPNWLMLVVIILGAAANAAINDLRGGEGATVIARWSTDDQIGALLDSFDKPGHEVTNGATYIWATEASGAYDYGFYHWRNIVFGYFPGQVFGYEVKKRSCSTRTLMYIVGPGATRC